MGDREWLLAEIGRLEREEASLSKLRRRLHEQIDRGIANDTLLQRERDVSDERRTIHRRIDELRAQLGSQEQ